MKSYRKELWFNTPTRVAFINITPQVQECIDESGVKEGLALVNAMHITASVFINDDESACGSKNWRRTSPSTNIAITRPAKTTPTRTSSGRSWAGKWSWRSPGVNSTSVPGSRFFTANSTDAGVSAYW